MVFTEGVGKGKRSAIFLWLWTFITFGRADQWSGPSGRSIEVIVHVIPRLFEPQIVDATGMFWLALLGIAFNGFAFWRHRKSQSLNARMVNWHLLEDILG